MLCARNEIVVAVEVAVVIAVIAIVVVATTVATVCGRHLVRAVVVGAVVV